MEIIMKNGNVKDLVLIAVMAAVICVLGPLSIPVGPIPVSLCNFAILITIYVLGMKRGTISVLIYLLLGLVGLPVFSGFSGGAAKLMGPTGGYLIGYIPMALIAGFFLEKFSRKIIPSFIGMVLGTAVLYALGTAWLAYSTGMTFRAALAAGVIPFIAIDCAKMAVAAILGPVLYNALNRAGLLGQRAGANA